MPCTSHAVKSRALDVMIERIQAAIEAGIVLVEWDEGNPDAADSVRLTHAELIRFLIVLAPEQFADRAALPQPTASLPGSPLKVVELMRRLVAGEQLYHPNDVRVQPTEATNKRLSPATRKAVLAWKGRASQEATAKRFGISWTSVMRIWNA